MSVPTIVRYMIDAVNNGIATANIKLAEYQHIAPYKNRQPIPLLAFVSSLGWLRKLVPFFTTPALKTSLDRDLNFFPIRKVKILMSRKMMFAKHTTIMRRARTECVKLVFLIIEKV